MHNDIKQDDIKHNMTAKPIWLRLLYMILFIIFYGVAEIVLGVVVLFQFIVSFSGKTNANLRKLGQQLALYIYAIIRFLTYNSEDLPFPFGEWPKSDAKATKTARTTKKSTSTKKTSP